MHGPTHGGRERPGPANSRSCTIQARPDEEPFYKGPARAYGPGAASELGPTPDRARAQTWPEASPYHSQGTLEKVLAQPDQSIKTLLLHGNYYLRKAWL